MRIRAKFPALYWANEEVREFWLREYEGCRGRFRAEAIAAIQNKVGAFLSNPLLARIVTTRHSAFNLRDVLDHGKILLVNLAKGRIGEDTTSLLGAFKVAHLGRSALRQTYTPESNRRDAYLYLDEFQTFNTLSVANMLSESRKYQMNLVLAHQFLDQLEPHVRDAVLGRSAEEAKLPGALLALEARGMVACSARARRGSARGGGHRQPEEVVCTLTPTGSLRLLLRRWWLVGASLCLRR